MCPLFDPARHEGLTAAPWSEDAARRAVETIAADAMRGFEGDALLWRAHPLDEPEPPEIRYTMLYFGAAGVIWALRRLQALGAIGETLPDFSAVVATLVERNHRVIAGWGYDASMTRSYLMGDAGLRLLQWQTTGDAAAADALYRAVAENLDHPAREPLWGSSGTMLPALHMAEATSDPRWAALFERAVRRLWEQMELDADLRVWLWRQQLYGQSCRFLGAAHGFVGNVYPVVRGAALLDRALVDGFLERALATLLATALRDGPCINWHAMADPDRIAGRLPIVQDCHGAPGVVCRLAGAPRSTQWDDLLDRAGELTWTAGPLVKGASLCHGTAGNGYAFLALYRRTGDVRWLDRARAFAMHAIEQVERHRARYGMGRWSLWTGDLGVALYLHDCIAGEARFPTVDVC